MRPYYDDGNVVIYHGESIDVLREIRGVADLVLTDPPYSSGGMMRSDRNLSPVAKYVLTGTAREYSSFSGDNRDQRSFELWCHLWMSLALSASVPGAALGCFIDWRNLPGVVDAVQVAGWVYRGLIAWDKTEATRPDAGWFRAQCEYVVLASCGAMERGSMVDGICRNGILRHRVETQDKEHPTQKPVALLREIIETRAAWQCVLDPFAGSGTTLVAAKQLGRKAIGIEIEERYCEIAARRLAQTVMRFEPRTPEPEQEPLL